jgi:hypothetical protein
MEETSRRSGYMPLSGAASGRPLMINLVSRRGHRQILLATFSRPKATFLQLMFPFHATCRRNLGLAARLDGAGSEVARHIPGRGVGVVRRLDQVSQAESGRELPADLLRQRVAVLDQAVVVEPTPFGLGQVRGAEGDPVADDEIRPVPLQNCRMMFDLGFMR